MPIFLVALIVAFLEITAVPYARINAATFDLQIIMLVFFSLKKGIRVGTMLGILFGILSGVFSTGSLLLNIILYSLTGFTVGYIGQWFYKERLATFILMVFCSMVVIYFSQYLYIVTHFQIHVSALDYAGRLFLPPALYTAFMSIFLFYFFREL